MRFLISLVAIFCIFFSQHLHKQALAEKQISLAVKAYVTDSLSTLTLVLSLLWSSQHALALSFLAIFLILLNLASTWSVLIMDTFNNLFDAITAKKVFHGVLGINFMTALIVAKRLIEIFAATAQP